MARLPFYIASERAQPGQPALARAPRENLLALAADQVGAVVDKQRQIAEQREALEVSKEVATLKSEWAERFLKAQEGAEDGAPGFTQGLMAEYEKDVQSRLSRFSERGQAYFSERATNFRTSLLTDATGFEAKARGEKAARDVTETINTQINAVRSNPNLYKGSLEEINGLIAAAPLPPALRAKMQAEAREQATTAAVLARSDRDPNGTLNALRSGEYDAGLTPGAKSRLINGVEVDIRQRNAEARAAQAEARAVKREQEIEAERARLIEIAKLEVKVRKGLASAEEIEARWGDGKGSLKPHEYVELTSLQSRADAERAKADAGIAKVEAARQTGVGLDYRNADDRKAVDQYFQQRFAPSLAAQDAETQASAVVNFSDKVGMVPESVQSAMRSSLRNGTPDQVVKAADFVGRLNERNPQLLNDFSKDEIALGTMVDQQIKSGVVPERAVQQAKDAMSVPEATRDERRNKFRQDKVADKIPGLLQNEFKNYFSRNPEIGDPALGAFRQSYEGYYAATGDADVAEKAAMADFKRVWSESQVNGKRQLMKYAPEKFYAIGGDGDYIRKQLIEEVTPLVPKDKSDGVMLVPDSRTAREASTGQPTYAVMVTDKEGRFVPVFKDGIPQRFRPDPSKEVEKIKAGKVQNLKDDRSNLEFMNRPLPSVERRREPQVNDAPR